ncbi:tyrosine-type recombinase/integrase [Streptomyces filamentosus]|uniref:tyrosine-type recombinase/integrase n=1 Tax=Streptomyces filamentosus TaxID=67294 RepID=UPI003821AC8E
MSVHKSSSTIHGRVVTPSRTAESSHWPQPTRALQRDRVTSSKTRHSYRTVPVPRSVILALIEHLDGRSTAPDSFLFPAPGGDPRAPMSREQFYKVAWRPTTKAAGLPAGTHLHDLRHTCTSVLIAASKGPKTVAVRPGDTVGITMTTSHTSSRRRMRTPARWSGTSWHVPECAPGAGTTASAWVKGPQSSLLGFRNNPARGLADGRIWVLHNADTSH